MFNKQIEVYGCSFRSAVCIMVVKMTSWILLLLVSFVHGNLNDVMEVLKEIEFEHLDFMQINYLTFDFKDMTDEDFFIFINQVENQTKPITIEKQNDCNGLNLNIIPNESEMIIEKENCSRAKGHFIKNSCESYLIYDLNGFSLTDINVLYHRLSCGFIYQPIVFFLVKNVKYELYEIQVPMKKSVHLASWSTNEYVRYLIF